MGFSGIGQKEIKNLMDYPQTYMSKVINAREGDMITVQRRGGRERIHILYVDHQFS